MAKKSLISFSDVGNTNNEPEQLEHPVIKEDIPEQPVIKVKEGQTLNHAISEFYTPPEKIVKKQVSIYLDTDVIEAFNNFGNEHGKGAKSDLVNNFLKQVFGIRQ
ncbi:uncharacterized protein (DUF4415 family) [Neobacillus niacini]|uniref:hypothetical protein n=1 Tax=Neobacillus driksii TaxID=3035913 RepID=UPI002785EBCF|nr:hypothetical protein [Neobacillus niacini]MDQ0976652.1 uncharacterized protein (DUF4415 family) [Neobacillus niacini]